MTQIALRKMGVPALHAEGLRGAGECVALCDTGLDRGQAGDPHPDLRDLTVIPHSFRPDGAWSDPHGHGTHMAGCIGGRARPPLRGIAPEATLLLQSVYRHIDDPCGNRPSDFAALLRSAHDAGARIHANAWVEPGGQYSVTARAIDQVTVKLDDLPVVVPVGNDGRHDANGPLPSTLRSPSPARNALAVGSSKNDRPALSRPYRVWYEETDTPSGIPDSILDEGWSMGPDGVTPFSGRGPTPDGRIKPDLVAPGTAIISTLSRMARALPDFWGTLSAPRLVPAGGTSPSVALVAGCAALVRQHLVRKGIRPTAALLRAVLVGGARPFHGALVPNPNQGWGRLDVARSLGLDEGLELRVVQEVLHPGTPFELPIDPAPDRPLRVTLAWDSPPAPAPLPDLDLEVGGHNGNRKPGDPTFDPLNTVERVLIPEAGAVDRIVVHPRRLDAPRPFALAMVGGL